MGILDQSSESDEDHTLQQHQVRTGRPTDKAQKEQEMRMPHERDESDDSQESGPRKVLKRAYDDLMEGQVDTDLRETSGVDAVVNHRPGYPPERFVKKDNEAFGNKDKA